MEFSGLWRRAWLLAGKGDGSCGIPRCMCMLLCLCSKFEVGGEGEGALPFRYASGLLTQTLALGLYLALLSRKPHLGEKIVLVAARQQDGRLQSLSPVSRFSNFSPYHPRALLPQTFFQSPICPAVESIPPSPPMLLLHIPDPSAAAVCPDGTLTALTCIDHHPG